ncbi:glycerophosphoryl diester phosphodiesterase [Marmoricola sp. OAE513]|uniref:glycerophosphodiester phosphodiesterase family protein n=1 Tax=Marmoricola sp. OAE513 TaxID=2817894 RepID=UPI001AE75F38
MALRPPSRILGSPLVIAHRGASGHRPEHTLGSYELAYRLGADSVELDVVATKDGHLVCRHDVELSRTTDVARRPEFTHLRRTLEVEGELQTGWFVHDFTLAELRELRTRERWSRKRSASASHDGRWPVPTLAEVVELRDAEAARTGTRLGIHVELKSVAHLRTQGLWLPELIADPEADDLTFMSFSSSALEALGASRSYKIYDQTPAPKELSRISEFVSGVAVRRKAVLPRDVGGRVGEPSKLVAKAHKRGLDVLVWTHRAENQHLPSNLRIGAAPHGHGDAAGEAAMLFQAGIDGLISDFPEIAVVGRRRLPGLAEAL